jgi:hypothetical protein
MRSSRARQKAPLILPKETGDYGTASSFMN